jgi:hypothetical protein
LEDEKEEKPKKGRGVPERPPGFFQCKRALENLRRFASLVRHHRNFEVEAASPIEELLPGCKPGTPETRSQIEREINKLIPLVWNALLVAGVPAEFAIESFEYDFNDAKEKPKTRNYDVILDYLRLPERPGRTRYFVETLRVTDQGIGVLEAVKDRRKRQFYNPLYWVAQLIRLPVTVGELAEFPEGTIPPWYVKTWLYLILIAAVILLVKLGVKDWKDVAEVLRYLKP